ncbi:hypothetical protein ANACOL_01503 [Anaerotruncus colihominis DSM 17241]|uniref:Uncharacterized protein n=1 Tax=Anaerotruncus colihominis DSM 17241 TaxID=445972 RepID=B0P9T4_9FIRM|nr:hypothetical protein ANACOL_01503 [Anaerotruncus colihominis DSM 17241]
MIKSPLKKTYRNEIPHEPISFWLMSVRLQGSAQTICNDIFAEGLIQFV